MTNGKDEDWMYLEIPDDSLDKYRDIVHKNNLMNPLHYREALVQHFAGDPNSKGLSMPWESMDGLKIREGEVSVWSGQNFHGKSAVLTQCLTHFMRSGEKVLLCSPEFAPEISIARMIQQICGKAPKDINEIDVTAALAFMEGKFLIYDAIGQIDIDDLMAVMLFAKEEMGVTMFACDNFTVLRLKGGDTNTAQSELMTAFVQGARSTGIHVMVVVHTRKPSQGEQVSRYNIRGASQISDLADVVLCVERNESKERKLADLYLDDEERNEIRKQSDTKLHCLKNRHGSAWVGVAKLWFSPTSMRWYNSSRFTDRPFNEIVEMSSLAGNQVLSGTA